MAYTLDELRPLNPSIEFDYYSMEFNLISLYLNTRLTKLYGSISAAIDYVSRNPSAIYDVAYILLKDKKKFPTKQEFQVYLDRSNLGTAEIASGLTRCFHESVLESMPLIKNKKLQDEYNAAMGVETKVPCYGQYYDSIAKRYAYTIEQFMALTLRQLHIILVVSNDSSYEELEVQAALLGRQLKPRMKMVDIDESTDKEQDEAAQKMLKEMQAKYQDKK